MLETRPTLRVHENILEATVKGDNITTLPFPIITAKFPGEKNKGKKFPHWQGFIKRPVSKHCINLKPFITKNPVKLSLHLHQNGIKSLSVAIGAQHLREDYGLWLTQCSTLLVRLTLCLLKAVFIPHSFKLPCLGSLIQFLCFVNSSIPHVH